MSTKLQDFDKLSTRALAAAIATGKISSVEATTEAARKLAEAHTLTHCTITPETDEALKVAKAVDAARANGETLGPLAGVPLAHKDMFDRTGKIASWGARIRADQPATTNATVIDRLARAGALQIAALHLTEFAFGPTGHNYVLGHARNPWDPTRITGGSSAGTACAVAYGAIPAGLGSDTAGSLRLPASNCGVTSIKPTWGRVSHAGAMPLALCLDTLGFIARHVEDLALLTGIVAGSDPRDAHTSTVTVPNYLATIDQPVKGLRLGIDATVIGEAHPDIQKAVANAVEVLSKVGLTKATCSFPDWTTLDHLTQVMQLPDAASAHAAYLMTRPNDYGPQVRARLEVGHFIAAVDHMTALRARGTMLARTLETTFKQCDIAILPINADPLPTIAELDVAGGPQVQQTMARVVKFCRPINYLGLPTLTLPVPRSGNALPTGVQIVAKPYAEDLLFRIGHAYQKLVPPQIARPLT
ncbi:MAG: amidase [Hyphomicrobiaceae bacterium]|nr:amidase [Hyphomicrobiaceae bacterium]